MKKLLSLLSMISLLVVINCTKQSDLKPEVVDKKIIVKEIFKAGMSWNSQFNSLKSTYPIDVDLDTIMPGPEGGHIHILGSVTGSMELDEINGNVLGGTLTLGLTETINDYAFFYDGKKFTMNGAPNILSTGTFILMPGGAFGTESSLQLTGGIRVTGPNYDKTVNVLVTIKINADGRGGNVSGKIGGDPVNFTF
jgi:hypothetical protein